MGARTSCPVCDADAVAPVLTRSRTLIHQHLVFRSRRDAVRAERGDLDMIACTSCGFVFNRLFDAAMLRYGPHYDNTQLASDVFTAYVQRLVRHLIDDRQVRDAQIVEVGCGKGAFIRALVAADGANNRGIGFDPSYVGPDVELGGRLRFERRYYDASCADVPADVVVSRHVIEHVPEPVRLLRAIGAALAERPGARIFLETPCVAWILRHQVIWDFFYEHCSLFTVESLTTACELAGFTVESVDHVFGGQYLWLEAINRPPARITRDAGDIPEQARRFRDAEARQRAQWSAMVRELAQRGRVAIWGAGAKGVTFANLVDPDGAHVACLVDVNPAKQGGYVAGTGHPIISPADLAATGVSTAVLLNPNYKEEVEAMVRERGLAIDVLDLGAP